MKLNMVQAINLALKQEMEKDDKVIILGEDIGKNGGVFRVTEGLWQQFGDERVIDTPLAELGIVGTSIGLAVSGMKPVAEIQFDGFTPPALDQIISHVGRIRNRSRGRFHLQMVIRFPSGGGIRALEHHSEIMDTYLTHAPGIKVVVPATPYDAKGLLVSAIRDKDPVVFMEPKKVYRAIKEEVPEEEYTIPIGEAKVIREGKDVTVIAWGAMVKTVNEAVVKIGDKYSVEVINLRSLKPLDTNAVVNSVKKTGRCVIVQEGFRTLGFAAELIALINERAFLSLEAPIKRVTGYDVPTPLPKLENYYLPSVDKAVNAIEDVMRF
jgi:pyruvate dehydrogenase E1 component beta subunit